MLGAEAALMFAFTQIHTALVPSLVPGRITPENRCPIVKKRTGREIILESHFCPVSGP